MTSTVIEPLATSVDILSATHRPLARDMAAACRPSSRICWGSAGYSVGMPKSASNRSDAPGTVDDFADASSPTKTRAPPLAGTPIRTLCRNASDARSNPGDLPYQNPMTPSTVHSCDADASWLP